MTGILIKLTPFLRTFSLTVVFNTMVALFITAIGFNESLFENLIFSQCIGLMICILVYGVYTRFEGRRAVIRWILIVSALTVGAVAGSAAALWVLRMETGVFWLYRKNMLHLMVMGIGFGAVITYFFLSWKRLAVTREQTREARIKCLESEKAAAVAHMQRLQAQIEPHFLFNTLSTILSLMTSSPEKAKAMLLAFTSYLRLSLSHIRDDRGALGSELDLIQAYLDLYKSRMGDRLQYDIQVPEAARGLRFPPMLLQPLVENAVRHGLEPKAAGGRIVLRVTLDDNRMRISVSDNGLGFTKTGKPGIGIANVKERLSFIYANRARFLLEENDKGGVTATIEAPHEQG